LGTDPDADRVGIAVKNEKGKFQLLNGNQTGSMLVYYLRKKWKENGKINGKQFVAKTIVTTELINSIADHYGVKCYDTLTGFKYIAGLIREKEGKEQFIGGGEESYGYLIGDDVRDKDAVASCIMIAEMVAYIKDQGQEVFDFLLEMYQQFGLYKEHLISLTKKGKSGLEEIQQMMLELRGNPPTELAGEKVVKVIDYKEGYEQDMITDNREPVHFPKSDVLQFITEKGSKISARPSGTEPKIKFYVSVNEVMENQDDYHKVSSQLDVKIKAIAQSLKL
jgi:phosphoglucomutase